MAISRYCFRYLLDLRLDHLLTPRMTTLGYRANIRSVLTPEPNFEPEQKWEISLRQGIERSLKPAAEKLRRELTKKLKGLSPPEVSKAQTDYDSAMDELRSTANEQYLQLLDRERQERRWAAGEKVDEKRTKVLMKEQQALLEMHKNGDMGRTNRPEVNRDGGRSQPSGPSPEKAPDQASLRRLPESVTKDRT